jgi:glucan biosynthesis protein C
MIQGEVHRSAGPPGGEAARRYDVDWLRVLAVLGLIPLHAGFSIDEAMPVATAIWPGSTMAPINWLTHLMLRTLLFLLAGMAAWYSLSHRSDLQYLSERTRRLVVPLIFVMVFVAPFVFYLGLVQRGLATSGLVDYLPLYFADFFADLPARALHMWFVLYLFIFALITLPLFRLARHHSARALLAHSLPLFKRPGTAVLAVVPAALVSAALQAGSDGVSRDLVGDVFGIVGYIAVMCYGYLLAGEPALQEPLVRYRSRFVATALIAGLIIVPLHWNGAWPKPEQALARSAALTILAGGTWFMMIGLLGYGFAHLNRPGHVIRYLSRASIAVYVLHVPVNAMAAYAILPLGLGGVKSYLAITVVTLVCIYTFYELLVRRFPPLRVLFGLPPQRIAHEIQTPPPPPVLGPLAR